MHHPIRSSSNVSRLAGGVAVVLGVSFTSVLALADDVPDTIMLANGGRIRGVVMEEDPRTGVSIRLPDATTKHLAPSEVKAVKYGSSARPPAPLAPVASVGSTAPAAAPAALPALSDGQPADPSRFHDGLVLRNTGIVLSSIGTATTVMGLVALAFYEGNCGGTDAGCGITGAVPGGLIGVGVGILLPGTVLWPIGQSRMNEASQPPRVSFGAAPRGSTGGSLVWRF